MGVVVGSPIPLWLQLFDGRDDLQPKALIYSDKGERLSERVLTHFGGGLYLDKSFPMPSGVDHVYAQYLVQKDKRSVDDYELTTDFFYAVQPEKEEEKFSIGVITEEKLESGVGKVIHESSDY